MKKITTPKICESIILSESKRKKEFIKKIQEWTGYNTLELIYRGTRDGAASICFHNKCDNQGLTITLCKNDNNHIFWNILLKNGKVEKIILPLLIPFYSL